MVVICHFNTRCSEMALTPRQRVTGGQDLRQSNVNNPLVSQSFLVHALRDHVVELRIEEPSGCSACCVSSACAVGSSSGRSRHIAVKWQAAPGDRLVLRINPSVLWRIAVMCYLVPALLMLAGAWFVTSVSRFSGDGGALIGTAAGLLLGGVLLRLYDSRRGFGAWQVEPAHRDSPAGAG